MASLGSAPPANLVVPEVVRPLVMTMWLRSPSFRRQCARLAEQPGMLVQIELAAGIQNGSARALIKRDHARHRVAVQIELRRPEGYVERIAHEIEHVLEALDGRDLPRLARQGVDGVRNLGGVYETARAQSIGQIVAREFIR